jgi:DNA topoisomerase-1
LTQNATTGERDQVRLYDLIWKRAISSQMANAKLENTTAVISVSTRPETFMAKGQVITFDGFLKVYLEGNDDEEDKDKDKDNRLASHDDWPKLPRKKLWQLNAFPSMPPDLLKRALSSGLEELGNRTTVHLRPNHQHSPKTRLRRKRRSRWYTAQLSN